MTSWILSFALYTVVTSTFIDIHERFQINQPKGWEFAPQPGDMAGASFRVERGGLIAQVSIRVIELKDYVTLDTFTCNNTVVSSVTWVNN